LRLGHSGCAYPVCGASLYLKNPYFSCGISVFFTLIPTSTPFADCICSFFYPFWRFFPAIVFLQAEPQCSMPPNHGPFSDSPPFLANTNLLNQCSPVTMQRHSTLRLFPRPAEARWPGRFFFPHCSFFNQHKTYVGPQSSRILILALREHQFV